MTPAKAREAIRDLLGDYVHYLDQDRLEDWVDCFIDDCCYRIVSRENLERGLPVSLLLCENKDMLRDRITYLREASVYNIHTDRHLLGHVRVGAARDGIYVVEANYAVYQSNQEGESRLFSVGTYDDKVIFQGDRPKFKEKVVIVDTFAIPSMLSTPL